MLCSGRISRGGRTQWRLSTRGSSSRCLLPRTRVKILQKGACVMLTPESTSLSHLVPAGTCDHPSPLRKLTSRFRRRAYESFWADPPSTSFLWVSILCSILCLGVMSAFRGGGNYDDAATALRERAQQQKRLHHLALRTLVAGDYLGARPFAVEALVLVALMRLRWSKDADPVLVCPAALTQPPCHSFSRSLPPFHTSPSATAYGV